MNSPLDNSAPEHSPSSADLRAGQLVGGNRYLLKKVLGQGGMGVVWLAFDKRLREPVALKFLPARITDDATALEDLRRETLRTRKLSHLNIVRIYDLHEAPNEVAFISMEYVSGPDLHTFRWHRPGKVLAWKFLAPITRQLCSALDYAHSEGVIHRDIKPANLMLANNERLKLTDFGLAGAVHMHDPKLRGADKLAPGGGTLQYMSPQQAEGQKPVVTDDIYSVGATLYELLTGSPPFYTGDIAYQLRNTRPQDMEERLLDLELTNDIPSDLSALVMACLAKDSEQRPQNARAILDWLDATKIQWAPVPMPELFPVEPPKTEKSRAPKSTAPKPAPTPVPEETPEPEEALPDPQPIKPLPEQAINTPLFQPRIQTSRGPKPLYIAGALALLLAVGVGGWYLGAHRNSDEPRNTNTGGASVSAEVPSAQVNATRAQVVPITNMVWLPAGVFKMGSPDEDTNAEPREKPQTQVTLTRGFWMGKFEVSQAEYEAIMGSNPSKFAPRPNEPVEYVSWNDCMEFCRRLTERERQAGRLPADYAYRLPTEAEWEYAARAGTTSAWFYGQNVDGETLKKFAWFQANASRTTHPVGVKQANPWGLCDMYGNVWEWCLDVVPRYPGGAVTDLRGSSAGQNRAARGGCYGDGPNACRSSRRAIRPAGVKDPSLGFRLALSVSLKSP